MWQAILGRILVFSNVVVPAFSQLIGIKLGWWNAVYALITTVAAFIIGQFGKKK